MKPLFIHIPKTAGLSIKQSLTSKYYYPPEVINPHLPASQIIVRAKHTDCAYNELFTVVRNPYTRILSTYFYLKNRIKNDSNSVSFCKSDKSTFQKCDFYLRSTFNEFIKEILINRGHSWRLNFYHHFLPQTSFVDTNDIKIFKYEKMNEMENYLNSNLQHINYGDWNKNEWRSYYTNESIRIVSDMYSVDFKRFGYDYEY